MRRIPRIGDLVRDRISGIEGVVTARTEHLNMCDRYSVQPRVKPDKPDVLPKAWSMDVNDLIVLQENAIGLSPEELRRHGQPTLAEQTEHQELAATGGPAEEAAGHATEVERE